MKKIVMSAFLLFLIGVLVACGSDTTNSKNDSNTETENVDTNIEEEVETAAAIKVDDVISAFQSANLEAENAKEMTRDDYGMAPMKASEAKFINIPSICDDCGGRVFSFDIQEDLESTKAYYDDLGKESAMLFSWTIAHKNILVQINGDLPDEQFNKYKEVLEGM